MLSAPRRLSNDGYREWHAEEVGDFLCLKQVFCWRIEKMQITLFLLFGFFLSILFGMVIIPRILVISHKKRLYDIPDSRKVHTTPVPRLGGLSFFPVILMSMFLVIGFRLYTWSEDLSSLSFNMLYEYLFLFVGMTLLYLVGVCDDLVGVGYRYKFAVQIIRGCY